MHFIHLITFADSTHSSNILLYALNVSRFAASNINFSLFYVSMPLWAKIFVLLKRQNVALAKSIFSAVWKSFLLFFFTLFCAILKAFYCHNNYTLFLSISPLCTTISKAAFSALAHNRAAN